MTGRTTAVRGGLLPKSRDGRARRLCDAAGMHSRTLESLDLIAEAVAVDLVAYSRDWCDLAMESPESEAAVLARLKAKLAAR